MKGPLVFIVLDALRGDHLQYMPKVKILSGAGRLYKQLLVSSGFCERSEIFTGKSPKESGFVHALALEESTGNSYSWFGPLFSFFFELMEKVFGERLTRRVVWILGRLISKSAVYPQRIPYRLLARIQLTEDAQSMQQLARSSGEGVIAHLLSKDYTIDTELFTSLATGKSVKGPKALENLVSKLDEKSLQTAYFVYVGETDSVGHQYGPHSSSLVSILETIDNDIDTLVKFISKRFPDWTVVLIGDHGMEMVTDPFDAKGVITEVMASINLELYRDFDMFVDSTTVRMWFRDNAIKNAATKILIEDPQLLDHGYFCDDELLEDERLPKLEDIADVLWWAKKGVQVCPDYFHSSKMGKKGMHGYLNLDNPSHGFVLHLGPRLAPKVENVISPKNLTKELLSVC